jgi:membrane protease YdiL (CAAX protease family)
MFDKKGVFWFLSLTFGLTWLLDLVIYLRGGLGAPGAINVVQLQMMMPALSAILLGLFFLPQSPIYHRRPAGRGRWFYYIYLLFTVIIAFTSLGTLLAPAAMPPVVAYAPLLPSVLGLLVLVVLRFAAGRQAMARVWLAWGNWRCWLLFGLGFIAYYVLQAALNAFTGLGSANFGPNLTPKGASAGTYLILGAILVLEGSILGIILGFGEEYGWRGYLQSELFKLGRVRGVLLMGVIWGAWHWPIVLMGHAYPDHPLLGMALFPLYTTCLAIVLGYAVLKSGSVLLAAFLHALNNTVLQVILIMGFTPFDNVFSFGIGIYGIAMLAIIALLFLRDPIWRGKGSNLAQPALAPVDIALPESPGVVEKAADQAGLGTVS